MAESIIKGGVNGFTGTRTSAMSKGTCYGTFDRKTRVVTLNFYAHSSSDITTSTKLFTIPSEYCPSETVYGSVVAIGGGVTATERCRVLSSGDVYQGASNIARQVAGMIQYII